MPKFKKMAVVEALAAFLAANNIQYAFGIGGHGNTPLLEALMPYHKKNKLRVVEVHHEAVAAHAATALKWMHGIDSVVFTSIGPGWFNTLIGQSTAMSDGYGYLVLAGGGSGTGSCELIAFRPLFVGLSPLFAALDSAAS